VVFPKQLYQAVPYAVRALKVPVDGTSVGYTSDGKLKTIQAPAANVTLQGSSSGSVVLKAPSSTTGTVTLTLPGREGETGEFLKNEGGGVMEWSTPSGAGDITGVNAGDGLDGGGFVGDVTLRIDAANLPKISGFESTGIDDNSDATAMTIDNSENVGIGTSSPTTKLDVNGTLKVGDSITINETSNFGLDVINGHYTDIHQNVYWDTTDGWKSTAGGPGTLMRMIGGANRESSIRFYTAPDATSIAADTILLSNLTTADMTIDKDGNVGIGTESPAAKLDVNGDIKVSNISASGSMGIGTTSSSNPLHIAQGDTSAGVRITSTTDGTNPQIRIEGDASGAVTKLQTIDIGANLGYVGTENSFDFRILTDNAPRISVLATGNVGIGTTSPAAKLDVNGDIKVSGKLIGAANSVILKSTVTQSITDGAYPPINFNAASEIEDTADYHDPSGDDTLITNDSGTTKYWLVTATVIWSTDVSPSGIRRIYLYQDGTTNANIATDARGDAGLSEGSISSLAKVENGESIKLIVNQTSGQSLNITEAWLRVYELPGF